MAIGAVLEKTVVATESVDLATKRAEICKEARLIGQKPYFYHEDDVALFKKVLESTKLDAVVNYDAETLHTYMPPFDIPPSDCPLGEVDKYGFFRLNLTQFLVRPNVQNVVSCTGLGSNYSFSCGGGNLGYLHDPAWACVGIYKAGANQATLGNNKIEGISDSDLNMPNILTAFNVFLGYDSEGAQCLTMGLTNGNYREAGTHGLARFMRYVQNTLKLKVYMIPNLLSYYYSGLAVGAKTTVRTVPVVPQFTVKSGQLAARPDYDMTRPRITEDAKVYEQHANSSLVKAESFVPACEVGLFIPSRDRFLNKLTIVEGAKEAPTKVAWSCRAKE